ncbi:hypothetical protein NIES4075_31820 [Tolypothrix sp. NIES-4075]|uniref:hypothetical protein n=1 Tax=Tolypothrix sp. NIES-4075 TaxID=2005459 RepID=UPI000B5CCC58|nr:hypothetical protein [Tolypothrix sp. NIES-4075]GAX42182.1 hypothetical protein NIES4075_31820 [Tolypothrix sp. NIES-4075]
MGKYDNIFNSQEKSEQVLTPEEAVAAIAVVTAAADSSLEHVDAEDIAMILWEFEVFEEYSEEEISEVVDRLMVIAESEGLGTLFNTANDSLSDELILDAFAAGVLMVIDEEELIIPQGKTPLLKKLQQALDLEEEEAQEIIQEVIAAYEEAENEEYSDEDETVVVDPSLQVYESPLGNFSVSIPVDSQQGGRVQSQEGVVGFSDDYGTLLRIDYYTLTPEEEEEIESMGLEKYLQSVLIDKYVPQAISASLPDTKVEHNEYLEDIMDGAYFVLVNMPKGSTISKRENNGTATKMDAYRGLLSFFNGEFLYIVSSQRGILSDETRHSLEEETYEIKQNILAFVDTIEFT